MRCSIFVLTCLLGFGASADELIDTGDYRALTVDDRSSRVGEILMIVVAEATIAESETGTETNKQIDVSGSVETTFRGDSARIGLGGREEGGGQTVRRGRALTQISARITERLPHGVLRIEGNSVLIINGEEQVVTLIGSIRETDIGRDNSIPSNRISDATIEIHGVGDLSDSQRKSLITRILSWLRII